MNLYLIRHAEAAPLGEGGVTDDPERPLTEKGRKQARLAAEALQARGIRLGVVLTSPLLRTRQTAEGIVQSWKAPAPELQRCDELAPGSKRRKLSRRLRDLGGAAVALVGHQPDLNDYAAWLIGSRKAQIELAKGGVACVSCADDVDKGAGVLLWMLTPQWMGE